jgi:hypothetical protein
MKSKGPVILLTTVMSLATVAGVLLAVGAGPAHRRQASAAEFQRLVGGLGFGPSVEFGRCPFSFDPRLGRCCAQDFGPVPGGAYFCPHHAGSVFFYSPLPPGEAQGDAHSP